MEISVNWKGQGFEFSGEDGLGVTLPIDGNNVSGSSPMKLLLHATAACAAIDVLDILKKGRFEVSDLAVKADAIRAAGDAGRPWRSIQLIFSVGTNAPRERVERAVQLSLDKYCSVALNLQGVTKISATVAE